MNSFSMMADFVVYDQSIHTYLSVYNLVRNGIRIKDGSPDNLLMYVDLSIHSTTQTNFENADLNDAYDPEVLIFNSILTSCDKTFQVDSIRCPDGYHDHGLYCRESGHVKQTTGADTLLF